MLVSRPIAVIGISLAQLRHDRIRIGMAVITVILAALATTLLAGTGIGVVETDYQMFVQTGRDLQLTGGSLRFAPGNVGGI